MNNLLLSLSTRGALATIAGIQGRLKSKILGLFGQRFIELSLLNKKIIVDANDPGISNTLLLFKERELEHIYILKNILKRSRRILELGANIGYYAIIESSLSNNSIELICCEPLPSNFSLLQFNLAINHIHPIATFQKAVSGANGTVKFLIHDCSNMGYISTNLEEKQSYIEVETLDIFSLCSEFGPDLIRMDIEGHETEILKRLSKTIDSLDIKPSILFETHNSRYKNNDPSPYILLLIDKGYTVDYASSSSTIRSDELEKRYSIVPECKIRTDGTTRSIYRNLDPKILFETFGEQKGFRTIFLKSPDSL